MSARNPHGIHADSARIPVDGGAGVRAESARPVPARTTRDETSPRNGKETALAHNRPRARESRSSGFQSGRGKGTYSEQLMNRCDQAITRASEIVLQAVPESEGCLHFPLLVGRALAHGSAYGSVSATELRRLHERLTMEGDG